MPVFVNNREISDDAVHREMQYYPAASAEEAMERAARVLVVKELLLQEAKNCLDLSTLSNASDDDIVDQLLEQAIQVPDNEVMSELACSDEDKEIVPHEDYSRRWLHALQIYINGLVTAATIVGVTFEQKKPIICD